MQVPHHRGGGLRIGEADRVLDRRGRQVPGLDHGHAGRLQHGARGGGVRAAGEDHALGPAREHRAQQALLVLHAVVGVAQQHLQAARFHAAVMPCAVSEKLELLSEGISTAMKPERLLEKVRAVWSIT
jgi:hypothetical protein